LGVRIAMNLAILQQNNHICIFRPILIFVILCFEIEWVLYDLYLTKFNLTKGCLYTFSSLILTNCVVTVVITEYLNSNSFQYQ